MNQDGQLRVAERVATQLMLRPLAIALVGSGCSHLDPLDVYGLMVHVRKSYAARGVFAE